MDDFFSQKPLEVPPDTPLATRMRPHTLDEYCGQQHLLAPGKLLRRAIEADRLSSLILFGPPGTGKTTLAQVIAGATASSFECLSGVESNVADIRRVVAIAASRRGNGGRTILFVDEIHRFNKAQQDVLLPEVENGVVRLIGATTQNPFFSINSALISRSQIFELLPLAESDLLVLIERALGDAKRGLGRMPVRIDPDAAAFLAKLSDGDARKCLNALEIAALTTQPQADGSVHIDLAVAQESIQKKAIVYDGTGSEHYDTISAFIKSIRGSDPDAAIYWLAKMLHAGEEIRFITRRLVICASEDIGLADSNAHRQRRRRWNSSDCRRQICCWPMQRSIWPPRRKVTAQQQRSARLQTKCARGGRWLCPSIYAMGTTKARNASDMGQATSTATILRILMCPKPICRRGADFILLRKMDLKNASRSVSSTGEFFSSLSKNRALESRSALL